MKQRRVSVGEIVGIHGLQGWVKVKSWTEPREQIFEYRPWLIQGRDQAWREIELRDGRAQGKRLLAQLAGVTDPDAARDLIGTAIAVYRDQLPALLEQEYYWADLEGMRVLNTDNVELGRVSGLHRSGANDVLIVQGEREHWVPFVLTQYVKAVDFEAGEIRVDWDPAF